MRILCLQHVPFEGPAAIATWAKGNSHELAVHRIYAAKEFPAVDTFDLVAVLGGPMSVNDEAQHPWLVREKKFLASALKANKLAIGLCLGAQVLANVLGARVRRAPHREVGWFPVKQTSESGQHSALADLPATFDAFHWHGDMFDIPQSARRLAESPGCMNQAFSWDGRVLALQFHLECRPESAETLCEHCAADLEPDEFVQSRDEMLGEPTRFDRANALMEKLLDRFTG